MRNSLVYVERTHNKVQKPWIHYGVLERRYIQPQAHNDKGKGLGFGQWDVGPMALSKIEFENCIQMRNGINYFFFF